MYKAPDPRETISSLLEAAHTQQTRWKALLSAIGKEPLFEAPSYEEPKPHVWAPPKELAGVTSGPPDPGIDNPNQPRLKMVWEPADMLKSEAQLSREAAG
jgi:hypothetical protein